MCRFETVAELCDERVEFYCRMNTRVLSPRTRYSVYVVFKKADICRGFKDVALEAVVWVEGHEASRSFIYFDMRANGRGLRKNILKPEAREDGWMETELGEFFNEGELNSDEIEMSALECCYSLWKRGLIILGIEIRPAKILEEFRFVVSEAKT